MIQLQRLPTRFSITSHNFSSLREAFEVYLNALVATDPVCPKAGMECALEILYRTEKLVHRLGLATSDKIWRPSCLDWSWLYLIIHELVQREVVSGQYLTHQ
jgi:hypothetical protein